MSTTRERRRQDTKVENPTVTGAPKAAPHPAPTPGSLAALVGLGALNALWALFLWTELGTARRGGAAFCPMAGGNDCLGAWDSAFASFVHRISGVPVAGWGLIWSLAATALPLLALWRLAERQPVGGWVLSAVRLGAATGIIAVCVLMAVSASAGTFCTGCFATYVAVAGYSGIALTGWRQVGLPEATRGLASFLGLTLLFFLILLYPGLRTPRATSAAGLEAVPDAAVTAPPGGAADRQVGDFAASLPPGSRQTLSDSLFIHRNSATAPMPPPRRLLGSIQAAVRVSEWTDVICDHCAVLHATLSTLRDRLPPDSFSVDSREFPLDGACNPLLPHRPGPSVRCVAAKARLCIADPRKAWAFSATLFEHQKELTPEAVLELAVPYTDRTSLQRCIGLPETQAALEEDIRLASFFDPDGTPLVAVDGRRGTSFGPFLYAMVLARGNSSHPAFSDLPAPDPEAHLH